MMPIFRRNCELALILLAKCQFIAIKYDERRSLYDKEFRKLVVRKLRGTIKLSLKNFNASFKLGEGHGLKSSCH
ncbi:MAG: hypothetical protein ACJAY7_001888 [Pseudohongiellaceae bacterium]|jgi:hypothetical protein